MNNKPIREVSPEEYRQMVSSDTRRRPPQNYRRFSGWTVLIVLVVASLIIGFVLGAQFEKEKTGGTPSKSRNSYGRYNMRRSGALGTVIAVSDSSITIQNQRTGSDQTFTITSTTTITQNSSSASIGDVKAGDTVLIRTNSTDGSTATSIIINPSLRGGLAPNTINQQPSTNNGSPDPGSSTT